MAAVCIAGTGQLGQMMGLAARPLGIDCYFIDIGGESCVDGLGQKITVAELASLDATIPVTVEFEAIPPEVSAALAQRAVFPPLEAIQVAADRHREKSLFRDLGVPTAAFTVVNSLSELQAAGEQIGWPVRAKTIRGGYDGYGQWRFTGPDETAVLADASPWPLLVEQELAILRECAVLVVCGRGGERLFYPVTRTLQEKGVLRASMTTPGLVDEGTANRLCQWSAKIADALNYVGVLAVEWIETAEGFYALEMAPRVHNSGHWTIEGAETSQFENHLRAVLGLPLGNTNLVKPTAMANLLGAMPPLETMLAQQGHMHDYGKSPRPGRKLGHVTLCDDSPERLETRLTRLLETTRPDWGDVRKHVD